MEFFDNPVTIEEKESMVASLQKESNKDSPKRIKLDERIVPNVRLSEFVTTNSKKTLQLSHNFLENYPSNYMGGKRGLYKIKKKSAKA